MKPTSITPILNISNMNETLDWFKRLGWEQGFLWGEPEPTFGSVCAGEVEIFLCLDGQGGRGKGANATTFSSTEDQTADRGVWMSLWVNDVDEVHQHCTEVGIEVTCLPETMPWNVREMHIRHPDGHVFRVGSSVA